MPHGGMVVTVSGDEACRSLPPAVGEVVYRIAVEAVTNAAQHAQASQCTVRMAAGSGVSVEVCDDGRGLPSPVARGVGLESMSARAAEIGGHCEVVPRPGGGTRVHAVLPLAGAR